MTPFFHFRRQCFSGRHTLRSIPSANRDKGKLYIRRVLPVPAHSQVASFPPPSIEAERAFSSQRAIGAHLISIGGLIGDASRGTRRTAEHVASHDRAN